MGGQPKSKASPLSSAGKAVVEEPTEETGPIVLMQFSLRLRCLVFRGMLLEGSTNINESGRFRLTGNGGRALRIPGR
jgi:hypothetical protein